MSIGLTTVILFAVFGILLFLSCPISVSIVIASIVTAISSLSWDQITFITMQKMNSGVESFSLLAIPLFILAGNIMNNGGIARRLVNFAKLFVGWIPGSLAQANIVGNMLFGALSGSSVAAASAMGGCIYPIQKDEGYDPAFATAVNIASAPTGLLIPPTSAFIVYSTVAGGVSISSTRIPSPHEAARVTGRKGKPSRKFFNWVSAAQMKHLRKDMEEQAMTYWLLRYHPSNHELIWMGYL